MQLTLIKLLLSMNKKRTQIIAFTLASVCALGSFASVSAASVQSMVGKEKRDQIHTAIKQAFTADDYQAYLTVTKDFPSKMPVLTEVQFHAMVQAQKLRISGDKIGAEKILNDVGITPPTFSHMRHDRQGKPGLGNKMSNLTEEQKTILKKVRDLMKQGKTEEAKALLKNAGITSPLHTKKATNTNQ